MYLFNLHPVELKFGFRKTTDVILKIMDKNAGKISHKLSACAFNRNTSLFIFVAFILAIINNIHNGDDALFISN